MGTTIIVSYNKDCVILMDDAAMLVWKCVLMYFHTQRD